MLTLALAAATGPTGSASAQQPATPPEQPDGREEPAITEGDVEGATGTEAGESGSEPSATQPPEGPVRRLIVIDVATYGVDEP